MILKMGWSPRTCKDEVAGAGAGKQGDVRSDARSHVAALEI